MAYQNELQYSANPEGQSDCEEDSDESSTSTSLYSDVDREATTTDSVNAQNLGLPDVEITGFERIARRRSQLQFTMNMGDDSDRPPKGWVGPWTSESRYAQPPSPPVDSADQPARAIEEYMRRPILLDPGSETDGIEPNRPNFHSDAALSDAFSRELDRRIAVLDSSTQEFIRSLHSAILHGDIQKLRTALNRHDNFSLRSAAHFLQEHYQESNPNIQFRATGDNRFHIVVGQGPGFSPVLTISPRGVEAHRCLGGEPDAHPIRTDAAAVLRSIDSAARLWLTSNQNWGVPSNPSESKPENQYPRRRPSIWGPGMNEK